MIFYLQRFWFEDFILFAAEVVVIFVWIYDCTHTHTSTHASSPFFWYKNILVVVRSYDSLSFRLLDSFFFINTDLNSIGLGEVQHPALVRYNHFGLFCSE